MIGILDAAIGNLKSLSNAVYSLGYDYTLVDGASSYDDLTHLIIPGVGAYRRAMQQIEERGAAKPIRDFAASGRPVLGICLGMQILSSDGDEGGRTQGLDIVQGHVVRLDPEGDLALPHIGWNTTTFERDHPVFRKVKTGRDFYYVHSYRFVCDDPAHALGSSEYGGPFTSIVGRANVLGFQFHPEKSQANGLKLIENFCDWDGAC